jgi:glycine C-acetyltransferase
VCAALKTLDLLADTGDAKRKLDENTRFFRDEMDGLGFTIKPGDHPIVPIMLGDAKLSQDMAAGLLEEGVYVVGFFYPVVPKGEARIRVQISAVHTEDDLRFALDKFAKIGRELGIIR